jgi:hypothetical protein
MTLTVKVEYWGENQQQNLVVQEKLTMEQVIQCKFDLVCYTLHKLVDIINKAREEEYNARHPGAHT